MHPHNYSPRPGRLMLLFSSILLIIAANPSGASAQGRKYSAAQLAEMARRVPVTIAFSDVLPSGTSGAAILRRTQLEPHDVILLRRDASPDLLSAAVFTLLATREVEGDTARADATVRVGATHGPKAWESRMLPKMANTLRLLQRATPRSIAGVGVVKAYDAYLLPHALRGKMSASPKGSGQ